LGEAVHHVFGHVVSGRCCAVDQDCVVNGQGEDGRKRQMTMLPKAAAEIMQVE